MKAKQLKRIVDFINLHQPHQTSSSIRALLKSNPKLFIDLLNEAVDKAETVPNSVVNFIKEVSKQVQETKSPKQNSSIKENSIMENQKEASFIMRLVHTARSAWAKAVQLLTSNAGKVKIVMSAIAVTVVAVITSKGTAILAVLAALKSRGLIQSMMDFFTKGFMESIKGFLVSLINTFSNIKSGVVSKLDIAFSMAKKGGVVMLNKLNNVKNFITLKAKQAWSWVKGLFAIGNSAETYHQAAA